MTKHLLFLTLVLPSYFAQAQNISTIKESCFFESGKAELNADAKRNLDNLAAKSLETSDYNVQIAAFTDADGSLEYNQKLSEDRAKSIHSYLIIRGLDFNKIKSRAFGETQISIPNDDELAKAQHRRVEVQATLTTFSSFSDFAKQQEESEQEQFVINPFEPNSIDLAQGTLIEIPANAFCYEDGSEPQKGVLISCLEAYNYADMIRFNLQTTSNGKMLETGGMVKITATCEGKNLVLKPSKTVTITMPTKQFKDDMQLFNGQIDAKNIINWIPSNQKAAKRKFKKEPYLYNLDRSKLQAVQWSLTAAPLMPTFEQLSTPPTKPYQPRKPKQPTPPTYTEAPEDAKQLTRKERKKWAAAAHKNEAQQQQYQVLMQNYERNMEHYEKEKTIYETTLFPKYLKELAAFNAAFQERKKIVIAYIQALSDCEANKLVLMTKNRLLKTQITNKTGLNVEDIYSKHYLTALGNRGSSIGGQIIERAFGRYSDTLKMQDFYQYTMKTNVIEEVMFLKRSTKPIAEASYTALVINKIKDFANLCKLEAAMNDLSNQRSEQHKTILAQRIKDGTASEQEMAVYLGQIEQQQQKELFAKRLKEGKVSIGELSSYVFNSKQLNWINCDRFYRIPETQKAIVKVKEAEEMNAYVIFKDAKSIMGLSAYQNLYQSQLVPKGAAISLIAIKMKEGKAYFAKTETVVNSATVYELAFEPCSTKELLKRMADLN